MRQRAAKRDSNEGGIAGALEAAGWLVVRLSGAGLPDLLCIRRGCVVLLEVKTETGRLTEAQDKLFARMGWFGYEVPVVRTPEEALRAADENAKTGACVPPQERA